jgi:hypothetical protein
MFEFSLASIILIGVLFAVAWHFYATKILGYKSAAESALHADWQKFKGEMGGAHAALDAKLTGAHAALDAKVTGAQELLKAELNGQHDVNAQRIDTLEQMVTPAASAGVTAAAVPAKTV